MTGKHTKHDHCEHKNLEYCVHCRVVHCLDCKKEFPEKETVYVEKVVYKDRWSYPVPSVTWEAKNQDINITPLVNAVSDKTVYDKDRFDRSSGMCAHDTIDSLTKCYHNR